MPESNINKKLGMFMSCAQLLSNQRKIVQNSCRSAMLKYKSESVRYLGTVHVFILLTLTGFLDREPPEAIKRSLAVTTFCEYVTRCKPF